MKTKNKKTIVIEPKVVFKFKNADPGDPDDPTTSLATTTFTHLMTFRGLPRAR